MRMPILFADRIRDAMGDLPLEVDSTHESSERESQIMTVADSGFDIGSAENVHPA